MVDGWSTRLTPSANSREPPQASFSPSCRTFVGRNLRRHARNATPYWIMSPLLYRPGPPHARQPTSDMSHYRAGKI
jgi:hypothetical protein